MRAPKRAAGAQSFALRPGAFATGLLLKYGGLVAFGIHGLVTRLPSFVQVGGDTFSLWWSASIILFGGLAFGAVIRSWVLGRYRYEKWATAALILMMLFYSVVLIVRGALLGNWSGISVGWLPLILSFFAMIRYYSLVRPR